LITFTICKRYYQSFFALLELGGEGTFRVASQMILTLCLSKQNNIRFVINVRVNIGGVVCIIPIE